MPTQLYQNLPTSWTKLDDIFTLEAVPYVLEPELTRALRMQVVTYGADAPTDGAKGHLVTGPVMVTPSSTRTYYIRSVEQRGPSDLALTPALEYSFASADGKLHYTDNALDVMLQDPTSLPLNLRFLQDKGYTIAMTADAALGDTTITVDSSASLSVGDEVVLLNYTVTRAMFSRVVAIPDGTSITIAAPLDYALPSGTEVRAVTYDMNIDASTTQQVFSLRGVGSDNLDIALDITNLLIVIECTNTPTLDSFGDIAAGLTNGVTLRVNGEEMYNLWTVHSNSDFGLLAKDVQVLDPAKQFEVNGLFVRLGYSGQEQHGTAIRVQSANDLEIVLHDDLSTLGRFVIGAQGHLVTE